MGWTKKQLILQAFEELGLSANVYDITPSQLESANNKLNAMLAMWALNGVRVGWNSPNTQYLDDVNNDSNAPDYANEAIYTNLAMRLASSFGKPVPAELRTLAISSYGHLINALTREPMQVQYCSLLPRGAGYKTTTATFYPTPIDNLSVDKGTEFNFE